MISFLRGILVNKATESPRGAYFLIDVHDMGLEVFSSRRSVESAGAVGETITLYTSLLVREDAMSLVGFNSREERDLFSILHSAQGVGPKVALSLLSTLSVSEIAQAVVSGNYKVLTAAKGVGPKVAQRMTVDLKEKMMSWRKNDLETAVVAGNTGNVAGEAVFVEAETVLLSLGYSHDEVLKSFSAIQAESPETEDNEVTSEVILRESLRWLASSFVNNCLTH